MGVLFFILIFIAGFIFGFVTAAILGAGELADLKLENNLLWEKKGELEKKIQTTNTEGLSNISASLNIASSSFFENKE